MEERCAGGPLGALQVLPRLHPLLLLPQVLHPLLEDVHFVSLSTVIVVALALTMESRQDVDASKSKEAVSHF